MASSKCWKQSKELSVGPQVDVRRSAGPLQQPSAKLWEEMALVRYEESTEDQETYWLLLYAPGQPNGVDESPPVTTDQQQSTLVFYLRLPFSCLSNSSFGDVTTSPTVVLSSVFSFLRKGQPPSQRFCHQDPKDITRVYRSRIKTERQRCCQLDQKQWCEARSG